MAEESGLNIAVRYVAPDGSEEEPLRLKAGASMTAGRASGVTVVFDEASDAVSRRAVKIDVHSDRVVLINTSSSRTVAYQEGGSVIRDLGPDDHHSFRDGGRVIVTDPEDGKEFVLLVEFDALPINEVPAGDSPVGGSEEPPTNYPDQEAWDDMTLAPRTALVGLVAAYFFNDLDGIPRRAIPSYGQLGRLVGKHEDAVRSAVSRAAFYLDPEEGDVDKYVHVGAPGSASAARWQEKLARGQLVGRGFRGDGMLESLVDWVISADLVTEEDVRNLPGFAKFRPRSDNA